jgi:hypothetical protein
MAFVSAVFASPAPTSKPGHTEIHTGSRHGHHNPLPTRSARAPVSLATSPDTGGRRRTGLARPGNNDDPRESSASALRVDLDAVGTAASRRAAGANTPFVEAAPGLSGTQGDRGDSGCLVGPHHGAPVPTGRSAITTPAGLSGAGDHAADAGPSLATVISSAVLVAVLGLSGLRWLELRRRTIHLIRSIEAGGLPGLERHPQVSGGDPVAGRGNPPGRHRQAVSTASAGQTLARGRCPPSQATGTWAGAEDGPGI